VIDRGAVVHVKNSCGEDALMWTAFNGQIPAVTLLLDQGADLNARNNDGRNALMYAAAIINMTELSSF
jgi:ankyrin repeat protein